ncbi:uncharacterized protein LOC130735889 [Lotus japonicus]|uniref:uncharacterized protein LOC130735889 n=1 Tax=Lotus japonicus TaxID=34305 RepID=UPI00258D9CEF|nr:uncharacterized protein LOC130735889 [Lotus japonicus]
MDSPHQSTVLAGAPPSSPHGSSTVSLITHQPQHTVLAEVPPSSSVTQQPVLAAVASEAKAPPSLPHSSSTVVRIAAPPSSSKLAASTMAQYWFAMLAGFTLGMFGALPWFFLQMEGELPFYIATLVGIFEAALVLCASWCFPKNKFYRKFMLIHVFVTSLAVYVPASLILLKISSLKLEWMLFGVMGVIVLSCLVHDYIVELQFRLGESLAMYLAWLVMGWALRCAHEKAFGQAMVVFYTPAFAVLLAVIFAYALMPRPH